MQRHWSLSTCYRTDCKHPRCKDVLAEQPFCAEFNQVYRTPSQDVADTNDETTAARTLGLYNLHRAVNFNVFTRNEKSASHLHGSGAMPHGMCKACAGLRAMCVLRRHFSSSLPPRKSMSAQASHSDSANSVASV